MKQKVKLVVRSKYLPILILVFAILLAFVLKIAGNNFVPKSQNENLPKVKVQVVEVKNVDVPIHTQGVVSPKTEINLSAEISGKVIEVTSKLASGKAFKKDDVLFKVDSSNYLLEITKVKAAVAKAKLNLTHAKSRGAKALLNEAKASLAATQASLKLARMQLEKTKVKAPFDGMVKDTDIGFGQFVTPGMPLARIYATDVAEVRLPLTDVQVGLVDIPADGTPNVELPDVEIAAIYAGKKYYWHGKIVRFESNVDERNRLQYVVAQIDNPFIKDGSNPQRPILVSGLFVRAKLQGKKLMNVAAIPRRALRNNDSVLVINKEHRLKIRKVNVVFRGKELIFVDSGLQTGERVVLTSLDVVVDGMRVQISGSITDKTTANLKDTKKQKPLGKEKEGDAKKEDATQVDKNVGKKDKPQVDKS